jgi:hypothetical protein
MKIGTVDIHSARYAQLVRSHGSVFNDPAWLQMYGDKLITQGIYNANEELIGAFNVYRGRKAGLDYYIVPPFSPSNGFFYVNPAQQNASRIATEKEIHEALSSYLRRLKGFLKITAFPVGVTDMQVYYWKGYKVVPNYTYRLSLHGDPESLFAGLSSEKRKSVRKAEKDGIIVSQVTDMHVVESLVNMTFSRKEKSLNSGLLKHILFNYANPSNSFAFVAMQGGTPIAATFCVHDAKTCYYLFGGYDHTRRHHGAGPSCMWSAILHARSLEIGVFDFEGSMLPEVEIYFREFGGEQVPYYTVQRGWLLAEMALKLRMRNRF